jgi:hypothetical protein
VTGPGRARGALQRRSSPGRLPGGSRGQSLVEFALVVPVFLLLLLGMLEFGIAFTHTQTIAYATREGARTGAALSKGNTAYKCTTANFDAPIIAAVERVLESPGSPVDLTRISSIKVYLAKNDGTPTASLNLWTRSPGGGPTIDGKALDYKQTSTGWDPCTRKDGVNADGLGVALDYNYQYQTSLGGLMRFMFGTSSSSLLISDKTVMNLNPTNQ